VREAFASADLSYKRPKKTILDIPPSVVRKYVRYQIMTPLTKGEGLLAPVRRGGLPIMFPFGISAFALQEASN
jgi:hypothetical protein